MSWGVTVAKTPASEFPDAVRAAQITDTSNPAPLLEQWHAQLVAAQDAVLAIFDTAPFGEGGEYSASMSGHANHAGAGDGTYYTTSEFVHVTINRYP